MYDNGEGVPQNDAEAVNWYRLAAEQGDAVAQYNLGGMYADGEGISEVYVLGYAWLNLAAAQGDELANENENNLRARMTAEQIARAEELSATVYVRVN